MRRGLALTFPEFTTVKRSGLSRTHTLRLRLPCEQTLPFALILFALLLVVSELLVRTKVFQAHVVASNRGGRHGQFELQLGRLETVVARDGPIDCIFLGNSMVWHSFDPEAFAQGYRRKTGQDIRCFNFGVDGLPPAAAGELAPVLADGYGPRLLIYGTTARDYAMAVESNDNTVLLEMPWLRYRLGEFSIQGWFLDHAQIYQYWQTLGYLVRLKERSLLLTGYYAALKSNYGFYGLEGVSTSAGVPLDPESADRQIRGYFGLLWEYEMLPENISGLEQVLALDGDTQVLVIEMPIPPNYLGFFGNGRQDYQRFIDQVDAVALSRKVTFWQTTGQQLIPDQGWHDYVYPNTEGAWIFSEWLGEQLGSHVVEGKLRDPVAKRQDGT